VVQKPPTQSLTLFFPFFSLIAIPANNDGGFFFRWFEMVVVWKACFGTKGVKGRRGGREVPGSGGFGVCPKSDGSEGRTWHTVAEVGLVAARQCP
jgi:hypothetical protein